MSDLDRYDVEAMIRDASYDIRGELRSYVDGIADELREAIGAERVERQEGDESLERVLASRTEHLA